MGTSLDSRCWVRVTVLALCCVLGPIAFAEDTSRVEISPLDRGFAGLYNLDFTGAQKDFSMWQKLHPDGESCFPRFGNPKNALLGYF